MNKAFFILVISCLALDSNAQVVINPLLPPTSLTIKRQLWSLSIVNSTGEPLQAQIGLTMTSLDNNQVVLTANSGLISFPKGLKLIKFADVSPMVYNVVSPDYNINGNEDGFLPVGNFQVCYTLSHLKEGGSEPIAEDCESIAVEPLSPPQLAYPADSEWVDRDRPLFNWLPPAPLQLFSNLNYDFKLAEVLPLQTAGEAIQQNLPLEFKDGLKMANYQYPMSLPGLDTGKLYAWQVTAKNGLSEVAKSEIWVFRIRDNQGPVIPKTQHYFVRFKQQTDAGFVVSDGVLPYLYNNEYNDKTVAFNVYDLSDGGQSKLPMDSSYIALKMGANMGQLDFNGSKTLKDKHIYLLEFINSRREHWYVKFQYRQTK